MEFCRQEYWGREPFPPPGDFPEPGIEPCFQRQILYCLSQRGWDVWFSLINRHLLIFPLPGFCCKNSYICWLLPYLFGVVPQSYVSGLGLSPQKVCLIKCNSQLTFRLWFFFFFNQLTEAFLIFSSALGLLLWKILRGISLRVEGRLPAWYPKRWIRRSQYSSWNFLCCPSEWNPITSWPSSCSLDVGRSTHASTSVPPGLSPSSLQVLPSRPPPLVAQG